MLVVEHFADPAGQGRLLEVRHGGGEGVVAEHAAGDRDRPGVVEHGDGQGEELSTIAPQLGVGGGHLGRGEVAEADRAIAPAHDAIEVDVGVGDASGAELAQLVPETLDGRVG